MRALLLDLGNVLVAFDHGRTLRRIGEAAGVEPEALREPLFGALEKELDRGRLAPVAFFRAAEERAGIAPLSDALWTEAWRDIFTPLPAALALLPRLAVPAALVSNTNALHWEGVLGVAPAVAALPALALSYRLGSVKPEPEIYLAALAMLGAEARDAVYADDREELVEGARALGMDAFLVSDERTLETELARRGLLGNGETSRSEALRRGAALFSEGCYFEAHEEWEALWMRSRGAEKRLLQGLIQLAAGLHHRVHGRDLPAARLVDLAREKLLEGELASMPLDPLRALLPEAAEGRLRAFFRAASARIGQEARAARSDGGDQAGVDAPVGGPERA